MLKTIVRCTGLVGAWLLAALLLGPWSATTARAGEQLRPYFPPPPINQPSGTVTQPSYLADFARKIQGLDKAQLDELKSGLEANKRKAMADRDQSKALYFQSLVDQVERTKIQRGIK